MVDLKFEQHLLDSLCRILVSERDFGRARDSLPDIFLRHQEVIPVARKHKVVTILYENLNQLSLRGELPSTCSPLISLIDQCQSEYDYAVRHRLLLETQLHDTILTLDGDIRLTAPILVLKGFSNARFYPEPYLRWMRDIDLMCAGWDDARLVYEMLVDRGYFIDRDENPWLKSSKPNGIALYGQNFLRKKIGDDECRFDIHFSCYSVGFNGLLKLDIDRITTSFLSRGTHIRGLTAEGCILLAFAHMLSDGYVSIKDINDIVAATLCTKLDWSWIGEQARENNLVPQATRLAQTLQALYDEPAIEESCMQLLDSIGTPATPRFWEVHNRSWTLRASVNSLYAFDVHRANHSRISSIYEALRCFLYYIRRLKVEVRKRSLYEKALLLLIPKPDLRLFVLRSDTVVVLVEAGAVNINAHDIEIHLRKLEDNVPSEHRELTWRVWSEGLYYVCYGQQEFIITPRHIFIPSQDLIITPQQHNLASDLKRLLSQ